MDLAWFFFGLPAFITIMGIPSCIQHLRLAGISLFPIGKSIVSREVAGMPLVRAFDPSRSASLSYRMR